MATAPGPWTAAPSGIRLTLEIWHPGCWAIAATERAEGGILAHAIYNSPQSGAPDAVSGLFTAFGETSAAVDRLVDEVAASPHAGAVSRLQTRFDRRTRVASGAVFNEFFLEYPPRDMICPTLLEHGFVHSAPVRIEGGRETWEVVFAGPRDEIERCLDGVREAGPAEVAVERIRGGGAENSQPERNKRVDSLTPAQRQAYELARSNGYYAWPRGISTRALAELSDVSKTTLLEHLRKAESKLLDP